MGSKALMNALDARQTDALTEVFNIAVGLTASKLSEISGSRVLINVPIVGIHPMDGLAKQLESLELGEVAVHQAFTGPISGDAMLLLNCEGAVRLGNVFIEEGLQSNRVDSSIREILTEIGNMLFGSCLGVFGNLLDVRVTFSPPAVHPESLQPLLTSLSIGGNEPRYAVLMATSFLIRQHEVAGKLAIVMGSSSLKRSIQAVDVWEGSQCNA